MTVTVTPARFVIVDFDAALIARLADELAALLGLAGEAVTVVVDEETVLSRTRVEVDGGITVRVESGAFEDTRRPRRQSAAATRLTLAWALLRARDRRTGFAAAPADDSLTNTERTAWNTYLAGRLARLGLDVNEARWRYDFRNRFGFTDAADAAFAQIWSADDLDWPALQAVSGLNP